MQAQAPVMTTEEFIAQLKSINPKYDLPLVVKAFEIATRLHSGQLRKSGEPYIIHPIAVSFILANFGMDTETIIAGLMHDVVEDTPYTREQLVEDFGEEIARRWCNKARQHQIRFKRGASGGELP